MKLDFLIWDYSDFFFSSRVKISMSGASRAAESIPESSSERRIAVVVDCCSDTDLKTWCSLLHLGLTGLGQLIGSAAQVSLTVRDEKIQKCGFLLKKRKK